MLRVVGRRRRECARNAAAFMVAAVLLSACACSGTVFIQCLQRLAGLCALVMMHCSSNAARPQQPLQSPELSVRSITPRTIHAVTAPVITTSSSSILNASVVVTSAPGASLSTGIALCMLAIAGECKSFLPYRAQYLLDIYVHTDVSSLLYIAASRALSLHCLPNPHPSHIQNCVRLAGSTQLEDNT